MYETDIRVPLVVRGPNIPEKKLMRSAVVNVDIAGTILDMAGIPYDLEMFDDDKQSQSMFGSVFGSSAVMYQRLPSRDPARGKSMLNALTASAAVTPASSAFLLADSCDK
ncbi:hypothetical protein LSTR_LSTR014475 [Laodelphax striatellus]|uniref:N-sulphoglucosamine sulphohydrolase C-terminal domain-containing protein n=1 Tax=Laodelphax striatellus TaxID=195883 RepID=A0A482XV81_LAOST|nr:hypothetical protein LSTR_LSTR014475 [Laodelphax striatellus]